MNIYIYFMIIINILISFPIILFNNILAIVNKNNIDLIFFITENLKENINNITLFLFLIYITFFIVETFKERKIFSKLWLMILFYITLTFTVFYHPVLFYILLINGIFNYKLFNTKNN